MKPLHHRLIVIAGESVIYLLFDMNRRLAFLSGPDKGGDQAL